MEVYRQLKTKFLLRLKKASKSYLPQKICAVCQRPFSWRKKWERDWQNVKYYSARCRQSGKIK